MSIIRDHILVDGSLRIADKAAAAAVFELAEKGYVSIRLATSSVSGVRVTRTDKPADDLLPEQRMLLKALFERGGTSVDHVYLGQMHMIPVAQTLAACARALLVEDGLVRSLHPRTLYRRISLLFNTVILAAIIVFVAWSPQPETIFISLFAAAISWVVFSTSTSTLKHRRVFRFPKSQSRFEELDALRNQCKRYLYPWNIKLTDKQLPYELLWQRFGVLQSVKNGYLKRPPHWLDGDVWPKDPEVLSATIRDNLAMMASSLGQPLVSKAKYAPDEETQAEFDRVAEKLSDGVADMIDAGTDIQELASDLSEWGGSDGVGGDGGGGDGSGDGGGGDGGGGDG